MDIMKIYKDDNRERSAALFIDKLATVAPYRDLLIICIKPEYNGTPLYDSKGIRVKSLEVINYDTKTDSIRFKTKNDSLLIPYDKVLIDETLKINGCKVD